MKQKKKIDFGESKHERLFYMVTFVEDILVFVPLIQFNRDIYDEGSEVVTF